MINTAYKDYLIRQDFSGNFHVSKGGHHMGTRSSLEAAKAIVDELVELGLDRD